MRPWIMTLAMSLFVGGTAFAGGLHARIEGPAADGVTYTVRAVSGDAHSALEPWAFAEGVVDGKPQSRLIRLEPTGEHGVYRFTRVWPTEGQWMIRLMLGNPQAPATVATLRADGTIGKSVLYFGTDGTKECRMALRKYLTRPDDDRC